MIRQSDIEVIDTNNELVLIVEVKRKLDATRDWAIQLRRNILAHGFMPRAKFFMLALPDKFFLWTNQNRVPAEASPDYEVDARPALAHYFESSAVEPASLTEQSLELIIAAWLSDLARADQTNIRSQPGNEWLVQSGLFDALKGGYVAHEVVT